MPDRLPGHEQARGPAGRLRRVLTSHQALVDEELTRRALAAGVTPIAALRPRALDVAQGRVAVLTLNPRSGTAWLEAELRDGSGSLQLIWMGRRVIPGIEAGVSLRVHGRITRYRGQLAIFNPAYELLA